MQSAEFHGANKILAAPKGWNQDETPCAPLHVLISDKVIAPHTTITSVWVPSEQERKLIAAGENIIVTIVSEVMPPIAVYTSTGELRILDDAPHKDWQP